MKVVFMGKCKRSAARALHWLVEQGVEVVARRRRRARPASRSSRSGSTSSPSATACRW